MERHYFVSDDLEDLKATEEDFYSKDFDKAQLHVLSERDSELVKYRLHEVDSLSKRDIVHSGLIGAAIGFVVALIILVAGFISGANSSVEWLPFVFLAFLSFCFCVWEGGLFGIQVKNVEFRRFSDILQDGSHVLMVDINNSQRNLLGEIIKSHPKLTIAGTGSARPGWFIRGQKGFRSFVETMP